MVKTRIRTRNASIAQFERICRLPGEIARLGEESATLRTIVDTVADAVGVDSVHLALVDDLERALYGVISSGSHPDNAPRIELHLSKAAAAHEALHLRRSIQIDDAREDPRVNPIAREILSIASVAYLPLLCGPDSFGLMILVSGRPRAWRNEDLRLARYAADVASVALENFRLLTRLAESEERFGSLVDHIPAIVYTRDVEPPFRTHSISPVVETMLGYSPQEWKQDVELFMKLVHPDDIDQVIAIGERAVQGRGFATSEYRMLDRRGETRWFRDEAVLVRDPAGHPVAWRGVAIDITLSRNPAATRAGRLKVTRRPADKGTVGRLTT